MNKLAVCSFSVAFALIGSVGFAFAQDKADDGKMQEIKKQDTGPSCDRAQPS